MVHRGKQKGTGSFGQIRPPCSVEKEKKNTPTQREGEWNFLEAVENRASLLKGMAEGQKQQHVCSELSKDSRMNNSVQSPADRGWMCSHSHFFEREPRLEV